MANRKARRAAKTLLSRDAILALKGGRYEDVNALGGTVRVAAVSAGARDAFELSLQDIPEKERRKDFRARLVVMSCIDEAGKPLFTVDDIPALSALDAAAIDPVVEVAMRINGLSQKDRDELEGNS
ncbi:MAG: hypothetical protein IIB66_10395 [Proteobacteria bacterium]|nr:hypothetical protein [Pseudomonadota bacterium]